MRSRNWPAGIVIRALSDCEHFERPAPLIRYRTCLTVVVLLIKFRSLGAYFYNQKIVWVHRTRKIAPALDGGIFKMMARYFYGALAVAILVASASITTFAQVGELRGVVLMQQADGQKVPLAEAQIDVFRMDITGKYNTKTNKKGEFVFAGLPFVGTYTVAASHPTATPGFLNGVKVGRDTTYEVVVTPGDGKRLTIDDIKAAGGGTPSAASGGNKGGGSESASDKAKREELLKKNAEIEAGNKKITETNEVIGRTFKAGNEALNAAGLASKGGNSEEAIQQYTAAIAQYDQGLAADPEQPAILTNKAVALKARGVERFNAGVRSKTLDEAGKTAML